LCPVLGFFVIVFRATVSVWLQRHRVLVFVTYVQIIVLIAYECSPSDGTDGTLDEAEGLRLSTQAADKPRKKRHLRASRKKPDNVVQAAWSNVVPRNLSADAVIHSILTMANNMKFKLI